MPPRIRDRHWEIVSWLQCFIVQRAEFVFDTPSCMAGLNSCMQLGSVFFLRGDRSFFWNFYMNLDPRTWFRRERGSTLILMLTRFPQHLFLAYHKKNKSFLLMRISSHKLPARLRLEPWVYFQDSAPKMTSNGWWNATFFVQLRYYIATLAPYL